MVQDGFITIFPMYYAEATATSPAPIVKAINGGQPVELAIFNNYPTIDPNTNPSDSSKWTWWDGKYDTDSGAATLKPGLNNIVIYGSCTLAIFAPSGSTASIIMGEPRVTKTSLLNRQLAFGKSGVVFKLADSLTTTESTATSTTASAAVKEAENRLQAVLTAATFDAEAFNAAAAALVEAKAAVAETIEEASTLIDYATAVVAGTEYKGLYVTPDMVYARIRELDPNFKFNVAGYIAPAASLDLNEIDATDTLAQAINWFDPQSLNTKFVISELDTAYLLDHVVVAKTSRS
jgi:hypothetical protein